MASGNSRVLSTITDMPTLKELVRETVSKMADEAVKGIFEGDEITIEKEEKGKKISDQGGLKKEHFYVGRCCYHKL